MSDNPLNPPMSVLCKLGLIITHVEEALSPGAHDFDLVAMKSVITDPEVQRWLGAMGAMALIPLKRQAPTTNNSRVTKKQKK